MFSAPPFRNNFAIPTVTCCTFMLSIFLAMASCNKDSSNTQTTAANSSEYYPLRTGAAWIYAVDSFAYQNNSGITQIDTFHYYYKEMVDSALPTEAGSRSFLIRRFRTDSLNRPWQPLNTWISSASTLRAERTEENMRMVKLVFPLLKGNTWNGNMFSNATPQSYAVTETDIPFGNYPLTTMITQEKHVNAIEERVKTERYARHVGLIEIIRDSLNTQANGSRGYRCRYLLNSYHP